MALSDTLKYQKSSLTNMRGDISNITNQLNMASEKVQRAANNITSCFLIDGKGADNGEGTRIAEAIKNIANQFNTSVMSSLNSEITNLNNKITQQENKEKEIKEKEEEKNKKISKNKKEKK